MKKKFLMRNQITGMRREGSKFMVLAIFPRESKDQNWQLIYRLRWRSSVINSVEITAPKDWRSDRSRLASKRECQRQWQPNAIGGGKHHGCHEIQWHW